MCSFDRSCSLIPCTQCLFLYYDSHLYRFEKVDALGAVILGKTPDAQDVRDKMKRLADDKKSIDDMCQKRLKDLQDAYDLAVSIMLLFVEQLEVPVY